MITLGVFRHPGTGYGLGVGEQHLASLKLCVIRATVDADEVVLHPGELVHIQCHIEAIPQHDIGIPFHRFFSNSRKKICLTVISKKDT